MAICPNATPSPSYLYEIDEPFGVLLRVEAFPPVPEWMPEVPIEQTFCDASAKPVDPGSAQPMAVSARESEVGVSAVPVFESSVPRPWPPRSSKWLEGVAVVCFVSIILAAGVTALREGHSAAGAAAEPLTSVLTSSAIREHRTAAPTQRACTPAATEPTYLPTAGVPLASKPSANALVRDELASAALELPIVVVQRRAAASTHEVERVQSHSRGAKSLGRRQQKPPRFLDAVPPNPFEQTHRAPAPRTLRRPS